MIRHVVMWKLKEENLKENAKRIKEMLEALPKHIPQIVELDVGLNEKEGAFEVGLVTKFNSFDDLAIYDAHPEHQKARAFIRSVVESREVLDYEI